jgi:hypothetical protein
VQTCATATLIDGKQQSNQVQKIASSALRLGNKNKKPVLKERFPQKEVV